MDLRREFQALQIDRRACGLAPGSISSYRQKLWIVSRPLLAV